jgi:hypothetical protein
MREYPLLYRIPTTTQSGEEKSILDFAFLGPSTKSKHFTDCFVRFFVTNYPTEAAYLLRTEPGESLLLHKIMPLINNCDDERFLSYFGAPDPMQFEDEPALDMVVSFVQLHIRWHADTTSPAVAAAAIIGLRSMAI